MRQVGVSLIELMVAMLIGSILMLGLVQIFSASRAASLTAEGMSRVQENARFAMDYLQRDIRMAGHFGCVNDQAHWVKGTGDLATHFGTIAAGDPRDFSISVQGYDATGTSPGQVVTVGAMASGWTPALPGGIAGLGPAPGSDIIVLRYLANEGVPVTSLVASGADTDVAFPAARRDALTSGGIATPDMFGVADCARVDVFPSAAPNLPGGTVKATAAAFSTRYTAQPAGQTMLYRAESIVYYVAPGASGALSLWRARGNSNGQYPAADRQELVEGIESLQFLYGRDATAVIAPETPPSGNIASQDTAATIGSSANEWMRVGLVQVGLLASSPQAAGAPPPESQEQHQRLLGVRFQPPATYDARYRSGYEVTVALRNRLFGN